MSAPQPDPTLEWEKVHLLQQAKIANNQQAKVVQQGVDDMSLDWLKQFGQVKAVQAAGIPAPFSAVSGGFANPFMSKSGGLAPVGR
jgi:hypothetical protein